MIGIAIFLFKYNWAPYYSELPTFISEYKESDTYWISALIGAYYGTSEIQIIPDYTMLTISAIFLLPIIGHYIYYRPFGLSCKYRPVDRQRNVLDTFAHRENIVEKEDGEWAVDLQVTAGRHINEYDLKFEPPNSCEIYFVDYQTDKVQSFDEKENVLCVESEREDDFIVGVYISDNGGLCGGNQSFVVIEEETGRILTKVTLVP